MKKQNYAADALDDAARQLDQAAQALRRQAQAASARQAFARQVERRHDIGAQVAAAADPQAAAQAAARAHGLSVGQVQLWADQATRKQPWIARQRRNREIMRLAARGWTNAQLADRFGLARETISRIITKQLRRAPRPRPGAKN
jgi:DNA-binding NarL/FixJ family response regulator